MGGVNRFRLLVEDLFCTEWADRQSAIHKISIVEVQSMYSFYRDLDVGYKFR